MIESCSRLQILAIVIQVMWLPGWAAAQTAIANNSGCVTVSAVECKQLLNTKSVGFKIENSCGVDVIYRYRSIQKAPPKTFLLMSKIRAGQSSLECGVTANVDREFAEILSTGSGNNPLSRTCKAVLEAPELKPHLRADEDWVGRIADCQEIDRRVTTYLNAGCESQKDGRLETFQAWRSTVSDAGVCSTANVRLYRVCLNPQNIPLAAFEQLLKNAGHSLAEYESCGKVIRDLGSGGGARG